MWESIRWDLSQPIHPAWVAGFLTCLVAGILVIAGYLIGVEVGFGRAILLKPVWCVQGGPNLEEEPPASDSPSVGPPTEFHVEQRWKGRVSR